MRTLAGYGEIAGPITREYAVPSREHVYYAPVLFFTLKFEKDWHTIKNSFQIFIFRM